ncbi:MAG: PLP-dependent cysteine synthase family protein [Pseudomonadota bacterium]
MLKSVKPKKPCQQWVRAAIHKIEAEQQRSADTHLFKLPIHNCAGVDIYLKDESTHPTGSLKHRLARSLFLYALCNGKLNERSTVIEASSGSTAVSEAYFAQMLSLPFVAVMPRTTAPSKIAQIRRYGGKCHFVDCATEMNDAAQALAEDCGGYFMDQFLFAERATDWRGNNNIADSIFTQMQNEEHPIPHAVVMGAGTGGTSATIGRYIRYKGFNSQLCVVDPEYSVFYESYERNDDQVVSKRTSRIEGIGRPQVEKSFQPDVIDRMMKVPDLASIATIHWLERLIGRKAGGSTGTNIWGALNVAKDLINRGQSGSIVTLICDSGTRYLDTYYNPEWVKKNIGDTHQFDQDLQVWGE